MNGWDRATLKTCSVILVTLTAMACSADTGSMPSASVTDSAGVTFITYDLTNVAVPTFVQLGEHDLEIGVQDGAAEYMFSRIADLSVGPDGSLVASDALAQEIRVYDAAGEFATRIGQAGEGPGEFSSAPIIVGFAYDTVFALDNRNSRLTTFTLAGDLISTTMLGTETLGRPVAMTRLTNGGFVSQSPWVTPTPDRSAHDMRLELDSAVVERLDAAGSPIDTIVVLADRMRAWHSIDVGGGLIRTRAAAPPFVARAFLRSDGQRSVIGRSDEFELQLRGPEGELQAKLRVHGVQNPMTGDELRQRQDAALIERFGDDVDPLLRRLNVEFIPDRLQAFQQVLIAASGDIWVALAEFDSSNGYMWLVFNRNGGLRGSVDTPPRLSVFEVRDDYLVGVFRDDLDVSYVRRYPLSTE